MPIQQMMLGSGGVSDGEFIDNVFGIEARQGTSGTKQVTNGVNLSADGGLVITKVRAATGGPTEDWTWVDTVRGTGKLLASDLDSAEATDNSGSLSSFNTNGYTIPAGQRSNYSTGTYVDYAFKEQAKFFDIVEYTGNQTARSISHNLGSIPGFIIVKSTTNTNVWTCCHRYNYAKHFHLGQYGANSAGNSNSYFSGTPTDSVFSVTNHTEINQTGQTFIAYLFAHDEGSFGVGGDNSISYCGSYTGNGSNNGPNVNIGWEPSLIIMKRTGGSGSWYVVDNMRGFSDKSSGIQEMYLQVDDFETDGNWAKPTSTGFKITASSTAYNNNGETYIFYAVRISDGYVGKPAAAGSDVFTPIKGSANAPLFKTPDTRVVDFHFAKDYDIVKDWNVSSRLFQKIRLELNTNIADDSNSYQEGDFNNGWGSYTGGDGSRMGYNFKRHAGFDQVPYDGTGGNRTISHSLGRKPEMMWCKRRDTTSDWTVYHKDAYPSNDALAHVYPLHLNTTAAPTSDGAAAFNSVPTESVFGLGNDADTNANNGDYIMLLWASVDGISKCGKYTGSSSSFTVDLGFQPRFIIIKKTSGTGNWITFDTVVGWAKQTMGGAETTKYLVINDNGGTTVPAVVSGSNIVCYPVASGVYFTGLENSLYGNVNVDGEKYIYYAHA